MNETAARINDAIKAHGPMPLPTHAHLFAVREVRASKDGREMLALLQGHRRWTWLTSPQAEDLRRMAERKGF